MTTRSFLLFAFVSVTYGVSATDWNRLISAISSFFTKSEETNEMKYYNYHYNHTVCSDYDFRCNDGGCIPSWGVCDGHNDCIDASDETDLRCQQSNHALNENEYKCTIHYNQYFHPHTIVCDSYGKNVTIFNYEYPYDKATDDCKNNFNPLQTQNEHHKTLSQTLKKEKDELETTNNELQQRAKQNKQTINQQSITIDTLKKENDLSKSSQKEFEKRYEEQKRLNNQYELQQKQADKHNKVLDETIKNISTQNQVLNATIQRISVDNKVLGKGIDEKDYYSLIIIGSVTIISSVIIYFVAVQIKRPRVHSVAIEDNQIERQQNNIEFKVHIAMDLKPDGCALAFGFKDKVIPYTKYYPVSSTKPVGARKVPIDVLLNEKDEMVVIGDEAKSAYLNVKGIRKREWKFIQGLMGSLRGDGLMDSNGGKIQRRTVSTGDMQLYLCAVNGKQCSADTVFIDVLDHIGNIAKVFLDKITNEENITINDDEIQWIVTVPIIWSDKVLDIIERYVMKSALITYENQCKVRFGSDCAAEAILYSMSNDDGSPSEDLVKDHSGIRKPQKDFIVVDIDGNFVDIARYRMVDSECELIERAPLHRLRTLCGCGDVLDGLWINLLESIFEKKWMDEFRITAPNDFLALVDKFQDAKLKKNFCEMEAENKVSFIEVELPYEFVQYMSNKGCNIEERIARINSTDSHWRSIFNPQYGREDDEYKVEDIFDTLCEISLGDESLRVDVKILKCMFDGIIEEIISKTNQLLMDDAMEFVCECESIYVLGTLAGYQYVSSQIKNVFQDRIDVLVPSNPEWTGVTGAAYGATKEANIQCIIELLKNEANLSRLYELKRLSVR